MDPWVNLQGTVAVCLTLAIFFSGFRMRALRLTATWDPVHLADLCDDAVQ